MALSPKMIRAQMFKKRDRIFGRSLKALRRGQNLVGELMELRSKKNVIIKDHEFENFQGSWVIPKEERRRGVILYLHGGGFVCGDINYAKGFAATLSVQCGVKVFAPAYRLAPENPFPCALSDAVESYRYLLEKGYSPENIALCGESAGGGLSYSLCLKLKELNLPLPSSIIAVSPWVDLTLSGKSYKENVEKDPSMTNEVLNFFADSYTNDKTNPLASPLFSSLAGMPPSIIFVGEEEIMYSDSYELYKKLVNAGSEAKFFSKKERWHAYLLYGLSEDNQDFSKINQFLNLHFTKENKIRWLKLDNAAKIYPAAQNSNWSNIYRVSATLNAEIDKSVLTSALDVTVRRFPSICARLRKGFFWYYLEQLPKTPEISEEYSYPLTKMSRSEIRKCAIRVIIYKNRIALEIFHSLTDGTGAMIFLKALVAEYLEQKYGEKIPSEKGVVGRLEEPSAEELEDSFQKYAGPSSSSRAENNAYMLHGTLETNEFLNLTCMIMPAKAVLDEAHKYNVTATVFLASAMLCAIQSIQEKGNYPFGKKPVKISVPINLRNIFKSQSVRNFSLYTNPEIDTRQGHFEFDEIIHAVHHWMNFDITKKKMASKIAANLSAEKLLAVRLMPLFIKNIIMKAVYNIVGEKKACLSLSNIGKIEIPEKMGKYVERFDFILCPQVTITHNCGVLSYGGNMYINISRKIKEPELEMEFYKILREHNIPIQVESNSKGE